MKQVNDEHRKDIDVEMSEVLHKCVLKYSIMHEVQHRRDTSIVDLLWLELLIHYQEALGRQCHEQLSLAYRLHPGPLLF